MKKITHFLNCSIMKLFNTLAFAVALVAMMVVLLASCKKNELPSDFGGIQLFYTELDEKIFDGTMLWMGIGKVSYPIMDTISSFETEGYPLNLPDEETFEWVAYYNYPPKFPPKVFGMP